MSRNPENAQPRRMTRDVASGARVRVRAADRVRHTTEARGSTLDAGVVYLTREGCVNTATMRTRFDEALSALGWSKDYQVIDAATLPGTDARRGYGTPTILYKNVDLFGMPQPAVQNDVPT
jgi:hypothetical protein